MPPGPTTGGCCGWLAGTAVITEAHVSDGGRETFRRRGTETVRGREVPLISGGGTETLARWRWGRKPVAEGA